MSPTGRNVSLRLVQCKSYLLVGLLALLSFGFADAHAATSQTPANVPTTPSGHAELASEPTTDSGANPDPGTPDASADAAALPADAATTPRSLRLPFFVRRGAVLLIVATVLIGIWLAARGRALPIREITGLTVFEEAVARATEMGRPTLFTTGGACDMKRVQLFASMPVLRRVSELSGQLGNRIIVPCCYPDTMSVHVNAVKDGLADAGAMEMFHSDDVRFFPGGQFFFAIASMGWMLQERPAACFYFGYWEADALLFAETGQTVNAMQVAGTDQLYQVPFFIVSCDYTIIGEEFWASSAKISRDPCLLGSLGAQDVFKLAVLAFIVVGSVLCAFPGVASALAALREALK